MRYVRDQTGRFAERPHYEPKELDAMFERIVIQFLKTKNGKVDFPLTTNDLTVLIERDSEDLDAYADLSAYGEGVEGVTEFVPGRKPRVRISATLGTSETRENRLRTTLSHEYGHVHLHGYLFAFDARGPGLFDAKAKPDAIVCKRDTMLSAPRTDWLEWQAGYACGAILMPASYTRSIVANYQRLANLYGPVQATQFHARRPKGRLRRSPC
jgi:hypothetical protein